MSKKLVEYFLEQRRLLRINGLCKTILFIVRGLVLRFEKHVLKKKYVIRNILGSKMYLDVSDTGICSQLIVPRIRELNQVWTVKNVVKQGMTVLDIGANIGYYALLEAKLVGASGKVYAMEPVGANVDLLKRNLELNSVCDRVEVFQLGASNVSRSMEINISDKCNQHTLHETSYRKASIANDFVGKESVEVVDVVEFAQNKRPIDFLRMDIEGHEVEVFSSIARGCAKGLFNPAILFEVHFPKYDKERHDIRRPLEDLFDMGYSAKYIMSNGIDESHFLKRGYRSTRQFRDSETLSCLYENITNADALDYISEIGYIRAVLLEKTDKNNNATGIK